MKASERRELLATMASIIAAGMVEKPGVALLAEADVTKVADESIRVAKRILSGVDIEPKA